MTIAQIKAELSLKLKVSMVTLNMAQQLDEQDQPTEWISHWDNDNRIRVTMHEEVFATIKGNKSYDQLAYKLTVVEKKEEREAYTRVVVITPRHLLATF